MRRQKERLLPTSEQTVSNEEKQKRIYMRRPSNFSQRDSQTPINTFLSLNATNYSDTSSSFGSSQTSQETSEENVHLQHVLRGNLNKISEFKQALVSVYFSSNPLDSSLERAVLWERAVPNLRHFCKEQFDIEFEVVDLNAGFDNGLLLSNEKRLTFVERCQKTSVSTAFVSLIGHKYWTPSIPSAIGSKLFEILLKIAYDQKLSNCRFLEEYYERDENAIPPCYVLKYDDHAFISQAFQVSSTGTENESKAFLLQNLLRDSANHALNSKSITPEQADVFLISYLEEEVRKGILNTKVQSSSKSVCYIRTIYSMETDMNYGRICNFIDVLPMKETSGLYVTDNMLDNFAQVKLNNLKEIVLPEKIQASEGQVLVYKCAVKWMPQVGLHYNSHIKYLDDFSEQFQQAVQKMTIRGVKKLRKSDCEHEILCHSHLARTLFKSSFDFCQSELNHAKEYLLNSNSNYCFIHGLKGSGKTHLVAAIASELRDWLDPSMSPVCVLRFLGQTFTTSYMLLLLNSINKQLEACFNETQEDSNMWCTDVLFQKKRLEALLSRATFEEPIVILLDGLDRIVDIDKYKTIESWLPMNVPEHVKMIITLSSNAPSFQLISKTLRKLNVHFIEIENYSPSQCSKILQKNLASQNRRITSGQLVYALQNISRGNSKEHCVTPCALNLVFMHAVRWKSSKDVTCVTLGENELSAIHNFMKSLRVKYGSNFVRITASLICVTKYGITQQELEEILLNQSSALQDVKLLNCGYLKHSGKESCHDSKELSGALANLLQNLLADMEPLVLKKLYIGCLVYTWSNSVVQHLIESLYFSKIDHRKEVQNMLVDYYLEFIGKGNYPSDQRFPFKTAHIALELQIHLKNLSREAEAVEFCFLNIHWLTVVAKTQGCVALLFLLERAHRIYDKNKSILIIERAIRLTVANIKNNYNAFPGEMLSRTLPFSRIFPQLKQFVTKCSSNKFPLPYLLPAGLNAQAPGAPLRVSFVEDQKIVDNLFAYDTNQMTNLVYCTGNRLKFFDMTTGDSLREIAFNDDVKWLQTSEDKQFILVMGVGPNHNLVILDGNTTVHKSLCLDDLLHSDEDFNSAVGKFLVALWIRQRAKQIFLLEIKSGKFIHKISCEEDIHSCLISSDDQYLFTVSLPRSINVLRTSSGQLLCTLELTSSSESGHLVNIFECYDNSLLGVYASGFVNVWERSQNGSFSHLFELDSRLSTNNYHQLNVIHSSLSANKSWLALVKPAEIDVWNLACWKITCKILSRQDEHFASAYFCNEQKYLLVTTANNELSIYVWDLTSNPAVCISIIDGHTASLKDIIVPGFDELSTVAPWVVTSARDNSIKVWNLENLPLIPTLTMTGREIAKIFCNGSYIITTDMSDIVTVWRTSNTDIIMQLKHSASVVHAAVSNCNYKLVTVDENNFQYVWNIRNGENLLKIHGPEVNCLLITHNDQLVVSILKNTPLSSGATETSKIWKLDTGQVVSKFLYDLKDAQVTSNNTFLIGISVDHKLMAISLWTGKLAKMLCRPGAAITIIRALTWHDHVLSVDSQNFVTVWNILEETSLMSLDMKNTLMKNIHVCNSGAILTTNTVIDGENSFKVLSVTKGKLRKIETFGSPLMTQLSWDGVYLAYVCIEENPVGSRDKYNLVVVKLNEFNSFVKYPLEGVPTCLKITKSGRAVAVGLEEGRPVVFNIVDQDTKLPNPVEYNLKKTERNLFYPKQNCNQIWFSNEPRHDERGREPLYSNHSGSERHVARQINSESSLPAKVSVHMPRVKMDGGTNKPKVKHRMENKSSRVKVFI